jgi:hypothetical protein
VGKTTNAAQCSTRVQKPSNVVCSRNSDVPASGKDESQNLADGSRNHPMRSLSEGA